MQCLPAAAQFPEMTRALLYPGRIIALAHGANPASWGRRMSPNYPALVTDFLALLESREIPFVIVGGIALLQHVPARKPMTCLGSRVRR